MEPKSIEKRLSFILYEAKQAPRYYEISRNTFRFLLVGLPIITVLSLVGIILCTIYFKHLSFMVQQKEPVIINKLRKENKILLEKEIELTKYNTTLNKKLASGYKTDSGFNSIHIFKQVAGQEDHTKTPILSLEIDDYNSIYFENGVINFKFKMVNTTKDHKKISGHIFIIMNHGDNLQIWPANSFLQNEMQVEFNKGELFGFSRLRPVAASFPANEKIKNVLFKVLVFSRTGDLIHKEIIAKTLN